MKFYYAFSDDDYTVYTIEGDSWNDAWRNLFLNELDDNNIRQPFNFADFNARDIFEMLTKENQNKLFQAWYDYQIYQCGLTKVDEKTMKIINNKLLELAKIKSEASNQTNIIYDDLDNIYKSLNK